MGIHILVTVTSEPLPHYTKSFYIKEINSTVYIWHKNSTLPHVIIFQQREVN